MKCNVCGNTLQEDDKYCPNCGNNINNQKIETILDNEKKPNIFKMIFSIILISFIIISIYYLIVNLNDNLTVVGDWKCADYTSQVTLSDDNDYYFNLSFLEDGTFNQKIIDSPDYVRGIYNESMSDKMVRGVRGYLNVYITSNSSFKDGILSNSNETTRYEFGILTDDEYALVINTKNYNAYLCKRN